MQENTFNLYSLSMEGVRVCDIHIIQQRIFVPSSGTSSAITTYNVCNYTRYPRKSNLCDTVNITNTEDAS